MSTLTAWLIAIAVLGNIFGCLWLIWWTSRPQPGEEAEGAEKSHVWDDDLRELNNPMPRWWLNLFIISIVFGLGYLVVYPGLAVFAGTAGWSQEAEHDARLALVRARRQQAYAAFAGRDIESLAGEPAAAQIGGRLFAENCAGCHGPAGRGALGFPDLTDADWLYGGSAMAVRHSIAAGRHGVMPPFLATVEEASLPGLIALVGNWRQPGLDERRLAAARQQFARSCAGCHAADGSGNPQLGAPNLTDAVWLHGGEPEQIRRSILFGRKGEMPAHEDQLSALEIDLLTAYVMRISGAAGP